MDHYHWLLLVLWVAYCFIHSFMADVNVKNKLEKIMGRGFKYYRPLYSVFAAVALGLLVWFQFSFPSPALFNAAFLKYMPGVPAAVTGLVVMLVCINKYFYELSGLQAIQHATVKNTLQQSGLHKYVRHPLYFGTLLFVWGLFFMFPFLSNLISVMVITTYVWFGIRLEEKKLYIEYGMAYSEYAKKVPRIFPHIITLKKGSV